MADWGAEKGLLMEPRVVALTVDQHHRVSVGELGFMAGQVRAEELEDGSGWVVRQVSIDTEAEMEALASNNRGAISRGLADIRAGRIVTHLKRLE